MFLGHFYENSLTFTFNDSSSKLEHRILSFLNPHTSVQLPSTAMVTVLVE